jgi:hypothetical protein
MIRKVYVLPNGEEVTEIKMRAYAENGSLNFEWGVKASLHHHCEGCERVYPPVVVREALERMKSKGEEHNNQQVSFASYCPLGLRSAATLLHREALRVVVEADRGNEDGVWEHLIDTVVFAILMAGEVRFK